MRTSTKLIIASFIVAIAALCLHNSKLRALYMTRSYRDPLKDFALLDFKDFTAIDVNASGVANVKIVQGPFRVMVKKAHRDFIKISQQNGHLVVSAAFSTDKKLADRYYEDYRVYISCPTLSALNFDNKYLVDNAPWTDSIADAQWQRINIVSGFKADSIFINLDNGTHLDLDSNQFTMLKMNIGYSSGSAPILNIQKGNKIVSADLDIRHKSSVDFSSLITNMKYTYDPESKLSFTGETAGNMSKK